MNELFYSGFSALTEYLSGHVLTCLVPAFFLAGALHTMTPRQAIIRYLGPDSRPVLAYATAAVAGTALAVCSCTVLPLFSGIYTAGAGLGPAVTFLYSGPAINLLAVVYSARLLGIDLGIGRAATAVGSSVVIGLAMATLFRRRRRPYRSTSAMARANQYQGRPTAGLLLVGELIGLLLLSAWGRWWGSGILLVALVFTLLRGFTRPQIFTWLRTTLQFSKLILPWLLAGVFAAGMIRVILPASVIQDLVSKNSIQANFLAAVAGTLMYFATLTEVPILRTFLEMGMHKGPAMTLLLAGPAMSLPTLLVIRTVLGTIRSVAYLTLVVLVSAGLGMLFGYMVQ